MTRYDLTPLFRSTIGFDHLSRLMDMAFETSNVEGAYPPYNIEKLNEDKYRITMAVAGFESDDITLTQQDNMLLVKGASKADKSDSKNEFLHRGIASRSFERRFTLSDHVNVEGANLANGLLTVELERQVPEHKKPRNIPIEAKKTNLIDSVKKLASA
jgi:molecular chaperone IbpA